MSAARFQGLFDVTAQGVESVLGGLPKNHFRSFADTQALFDADVSAKDMDVNTGTVLLRIDRFGGDSDFIGDGFYVAGFDAAGFYLSWLNASWFFVAGVEPSEG